MEYFSPEENQIFEVARRFLDEFVTGRPSYDPKVQFGFFAAGGSHMRVHLLVVPRSEEIATIGYFQWLAQPGGASHCRLSVGEFSSSLDLSLREPIETLEAQLLSWLSRELPQ